MTDQPEILELIARYLNNPDDEDFKSQVDYFRGQSVENEAFFKEIEKVWHLSGKSALFEALDHDKVVSKFQKRISATSKDISNKKAKSVFGQIFRWSAAAAIFIVIGSFAFLYKIGVIGEKKEIQYLSDALPGSNKAVLVLADGRKISLTDINNGAIAKEAGLSITKTSDGQLIYTVAKEAAGSESSLRGAFNTIETPKGGMWQVKLPDGSSVWLNAASSLTYPIAFSNGKKRIVELKGEAYFEVAKDKLHPFVVKTARQEVEVLGTSFNINSYLDEPTVKTTLLEGNVRVTADGLPAKVLVPDEQAVLSNNEISILKVDAAESIDWKNGYFMFNNEKQESIMKKIARWYNVKIEYANPSAKEVTYYGSISRFEKVSQVLRKFEQTGEVKFEIDKDKITVY
ncbi:FecR family protein [Pedobacter helvus]|uniref:FecR family protein n=1 Tax=Pedobacter helvus TaxID=2563444 RepID=A0ABW9JMN8_9SPHI|nr:FecR family protein [Pedobacter ureilyticus]